MPRKLLEAGKSTVRKVRRLVRHLAEGRHGRTPVDVMLREGRLDARMKEKLRTLSVMREQPIEMIAPRITLADLRLMPVDIKDRNVLRDIDVASVKRARGLVELRLKNGRVFYSYPSRDRYRTIFPVVKDLIPPCFDAGTYQAGVDVVARYQRIQSKKKVPIPRGGTVIEAGAYIGYKSVRLAELVGDTGRVVAIEIGRRNYELLRRNVEANGVQHIVTPVHCGVWNQRGTMNASFEYANYYQLARTHEHRRQSRSELVPTNTIDNIIDEHKLGIVDLLILQLNGSEYEGLQGLERHLNSVKIIKTASYYTREGVRQASAVRGLLEAKGCTVVAQSPEGMLVAVPPRFIDEYRHATRPHAKRKQK